MILSSWTVGCLICWLDLVEFESLEEEQMITTKINQDVLYWIGLSDFAHEGTWRWQESHQVTAYLNW